MLPPPAAITHPALFFPARYPGRAATKRASPLRMYAFRRFTAALFRLCKRRDKLRASDAEGEERDGTRSSRFALVPPRAERY